MKLERLHCVCGCEFIFLEIDKRSLGHLICANCRKDIGKVLPVGD